MGHCINAFIGHSDKINSFAKKWLVSPIPLTKKISMLYLTDTLFDEITEKVGLDNELPFGMFSTLNLSIISVLEEYSCDGKFAYFETDYAGGVGTQAAILYENGKQKHPVFFTDIVEKDAIADDERPINKILKELGVQKTTEKDEFDSIGLRNYRCMYSYTDKHTVMVV